MLELRQKPSELSDFENRSQNLISHTLKMQIQRIITLNFTTYFSSFSSFKILHRFIKSYVIPTPNRVYSLSIHHFIKKRLKKLEKLKELEKLKIRPTTNRPYSYNSLCRDGVTPSVGSKYSLRRDEVSHPMFIIPLCRNGSSG